MIDLLQHLPPPTPDALRAARAAAGHSQAQAARCVGLAPRSWPAAEQGKRRLSMQTWALYLLATGQMRGWRLVDVRCDIDILPGLKAEASREFW